MFILFDGIAGSVRYFENDTERKYINLGNDFVGKYMFLSVLFGNEDNQFEIINHPVINLERKQENKKKSQNSTSKKYQIFSNSTTKNQSI